MSQSPSERVPHPENNKGRIDTPISTSEERWGAANLVLRCLIRHTATLSGDPYRFVAAIFDDVNGLIDGAMGQGADPATGHALHSLIDHLAGMVADDLQGMPPGT